MARKRKIARISRPPSPVDRISGLPDEILTHILSFLSTKDCMYTRVLSKRWFYLWRSVPVVSFPRVILEGTESLCSFNALVCSVLLAREHSTLIRTFDLRMGFIFDSSNLYYDHFVPYLTQWINFVIQRKLDNLHLDVYVGLHDPRPKLPRRIFTCRTLVHLHLNVKGFLFSAHEIKLPSLKSLNLISIQFSKVKEFVLLLAGSPILEELEASHVYFNDRRDDVTIDEYKTLVFPKLIRTNIRAFWCEFPTISISYSQSLTIDTILYTKEQVNQLQYRDIYIFDNLICLEIHDHWSMVLCLLHLCPKLQTLKLFQAFDVEMRDGEENQEIWEEPEVVPECIFSHLTTCIIQVLLGWKNELMLAEYILKNAQNLQIMAIECKSELLKIKTKLSQFPKASATCQLSVSEKL